MSVGEGVYPYIYARLVMAGLNVVTMAISLVLISVYLFFLFGYLVKNWKSSALPGPSGLPFFGMAFHFMTVSSKDILSQITDLFNKYGDIVHFELVNVKYVLMRDPEHIKPLLTSSTNITKGHFEYSFFRPLFNDGLVVSNGDKWRLRRKLLTPSFHFNILEASADVIGRNAQEYVSHLLASGGKPIKIDEMTYFLAIKVICETAMGVELRIEDKLQNDYLTASKICHDSIVYRYLRFWLYPDFIYRLTNVGKQFFKNIDLVHNYDNEVIRNRKNKFISEDKVSKKKERNAFLDNLLELDDSNPGLFTESDIREEVDTFMIAGHNPAAIALKFLHFVLANNPDVQEKVFEEQMEIFGNDGRNPTTQDLRKMSYLEMVIKETLRLYPSVPLYSRLLNEDLKIDSNIVIPAGQSVIVSAYNVHRNKKYWDNPEEFIPERFSPGTERHPFSFVPFSAGPRNCIGQKYAMMELKTIMSTVVRQCWLEPVTTSVRLDYGVTLHTVEPIVVKIFSRDGTRRRISKGLN